MRASGLARSIMYGRVRTAVIFMGLLHQGLPSRQAGLYQAAHLSKARVINDNYFCRSIVKTIWYWRCQIGHASARP